MLAEIASPHVTTSDPTEDFLSFNLEIRTERPVYTQPEIAVALALPARTPWHVMFAMATAPLG